VLVCQPLMVGPALLGITRAIIQGQNYCGVLSYVYYVSRLYEFLSA
jgi:hypothetical protein